MSTPAHVNPNDPYGQLEKSRALPPPPPPPKNYPPPPVTGAVFDGSIYMHHATTTPAVHTDLPAPIASAETATP